MGADRQLSSGASSGVYISLPELIALRSLAHTSTIVGRQPANSALAGRRDSRLRGRGLSFEELRVYRPGDDVRTIDWRVTARTRVPHTRVFVEERERPVLLVVDQRLAMFFGTRVQMKSVTAAELAALAAWQVLAAGDRIGGLVFNDDQHLEIDPRRSRRNVVQLLSGVAAYNRRLRVDRPQTHAPGQLNRVLAGLGRRPMHDWMIVIISDFSGADDQTRATIQSLARHNDVIGMLVHDPLAWSLPSASEVIISDSTSQAALAMQSAAVRAGVAAVLAQRHTVLERLNTEWGMPSLAIDTGGDVAAQLTRALGPLRKRVA